VRRRLRWRLSPFREATLARTASALALLLRGGCSLSEAAAALRGAEGDRVARAEFERWQSRLAAGHAKFADVACGGTLFPPLFIWMVENSGEDIAAGFEQAAALYYARADHRIEMVLYGLLPVSVLILGSMVFAQVGSILAVFSQLLPLLGPF
jgi:type II secretory pathway component PulF